MVIADVPDAVRVAVRSDLSMAMEDFAFTSRHGSTHTPAYRTRILIFTNGIKMIQPGEKDHNVSFEEMVHQQCLTRSFKLGQSSPSCASQLVKP